VSAAGRGSSGWRGGRAEDGGGGNVLEFGLGVCVNS